jgi:putative MFS transporter
VTAPAAVPSTSPDAAYQRRLLAFLAVATFFEGYDFLALAQLLPTLRAHFGLDPAQAGLLFSVVNVGTVLAYALVRAADRIGRKRVLSITITGYTLASLASGLAPDVWTFTLAQLLSRLFLIAEWAVSVVIAAEEFPAERRGAAIGLIQATSSLGAIVCAGVVPLLERSPLGWRTVYLVGALPLLLMAFLRRDLRETKRFEAAAAQTADAPRQGGGFFTILKGPFRARVGWVALVWGLCYVCSQNAVTFFKDYAVSERGLSDSEVGQAIAIAAVGSLPLLFASGRLLDRMGRRPGAAVIFVAMGVSTAVVYTASSRPAQLVGLVVAIFGSTAILQVLNAFTAELFPTDLRADAFAWANNLLGRIGYVLSPAAVGYAASTVGWGPAVAVTGVFPILALAVVWARFPETRGKELEETAAL